VFCTCSSSFVRAGLRSGNALGACSKRLNIGLDINFPHGLYDFHEFLETNAGVLFQSGHGHFLSTFSCVCHLEDDISRLGGKRSAYRFLVGKQRKTKTHVGG
jgi:hypothetical protein